MEHSGENVKVESKEPSSYACTIEKMDMLHIKRLYGSMFLFSLIQLFLTFKESQIRGSVDEIYNAIAFLCGLMNMFFMASLLVHVCDVVKITPKYE